MAPDDRAPKVAPEGSSADERLAEIRARLEKATPGPWVNCQNNGEPHWKHIFAATGERITCHGFQATTKDEDAEFIAHSPADIAYLLERVEKLEAIAEAGDRLEAVLVLHVREYGCCGFEPGTNDAHNPDCYVAALNAFRAAIEAAQ